MTGDIPFRATRFQINGLAMIETSEMYKDRCDQSMQDIRVVHTVSFPSMFIRSIIVGECRRVREGIVRKGKFVRHSV